MDVGWTAQVTKAKARTIVQQKAQVRAEQRQERMASMNWYGMSNSRPNAATTPFTSRYSSVWEMPGGRPYSWTPSWSRRIMSRLAVLELVPMFVAEFARISENTNTVRIIANSATFRTCLCSPSFPAV